MLQTWTPGPHIYRAGKPQAVQASAPLEKSSAGSACPEGGGQNPASQPDRTARVGRAELRALTGMRLWKCPPQLALEGSGTELAGLEAPNTQTHHVDGASSPTWAQQRRQHPAPLPRHSLESVRQREEQREEQPASPGKNKSATCPRPQAGHQGKTGGKVASAVAAPAEQCACGTMVAARMMMGSPGSTYLTEP